MPETCLVVFIDAYPFWILQQGSRLTPRLPFVRAVRPGFGYSINCQTELIAGLKPDEVGYWCEYSYDPAHAIVRNGALAPLDWVRRWRLPNRALHLLINRVLGKPTKDIPFAYLKYFTKSGKELFARDFPYPSILQRAGVHVFSYLDFPELPTPEARDRRIFEAAHHALDASGMRAVVLALGNLDRVGHWSRPGTSPYWACRDAIETSTLELIDRFEQLHPGGRVIVISDHGMSPVDRTIRLELERRFGPPRPERYIYFVEGTILRVWTPDARLRAELEDYLRGFADVELIGAEERARLGVTNPAFGDILAVTGDGVMWVPSFWGALASEGMHGYHPRYEQQQGIFLSNRDPHGYGPVLEAVEVAAILNQAVPEEAADAQPADQDRVSH